MLETPLYVMTHGFLLGLVAGLMYGTLLAPIFGSILGGFVGAMAGANGGVLLGLIYDVLLHYFGIQAMLRHRVRVIASSGLCAGLLLFLLLAMYFSFQRYSTDFTYIGLFGILPSIICALVAMYSAYQWLDWLQNSDTRKRKVKP